MILKALPFGLILILLSKSATSQDNVQASNQCVSPKVRDHLLGITRKIYQDEILPGLKEDIDAQVSTCQDNFAQKDQEWTSRFQAISNI